MTLTLIVVNVLVFLYELTLGPELPAFVKHYGVIPAMASHWHHQGMAILVTYFTSIFLHGGWLHIIGNMLFLWIFGDNVEDRMGHLAFLIFYLLCGFLAGITHTLLHAGSTIPSIGASGAIAGILGAYLILFPGARVLTLVFLGFFITTARIPAVLYLGLWFLIQFLSGTAAMGASAAASQGVAWWAHVGGFVAGIVLLPFFAGRKTRRRAPRVTYHVRE